MRAALLAILLIFTCACEPIPRTATPSSDAQTAHEGPGDRQLAPFLRSRQEDYVAAMEAAHQWLDRQVVDPAVLRARGLKGKKKLTELIDAYYQLWRMATDVEREALRSRVLEVTAPTRQSSFHDMARISDEQFKQDSTSYLRAAYLMDRMGLDVEQYREEIRAIHPRLNSHMSRRGPHQQHVFGTYYRHFELEEPFPLGEAMARGYIARRADPQTFNDMDAYQLTHEVFAPYDFGERLDVEPFGAAETEYLREAMELLVERYIARKNADLTAELVTCMRMLRLTDSPQYRAGVEYLLTSQNDDGSWGDLARAKARYGDLAEAAILLHTTMVAISALRLVFTDAPA